MCWPEDVQRSCSAASGSNIHRKRKEFAETVFWTSHYGKATCYRDVLVIGCIVNTYQRIGWENAP
jgi:hypothetical protein